MVDDESFIRRFVRTALEREGWQVIEAVEGAQALTVLEETSVDCVLLDVMLTDLDGFSIL